MRLVLASQSASRRAMLDAAGIPHDALAPGVDEDSAKAALRADGNNARRMADALAELKALKLSMKLPGVLVLGCDSTVSLDDGTMIDKAESRDAQADILRTLRGVTHHLTSAAVICENGVPVWRHVDVAKLTMRTFSDAWLETYLDSQWPAIGGCVGGYMIEGMGIQLFSRVDGSQFTILGLPLLPLLDYLRTRHVLAG